MIPLHRDSCYTFRFAESRRITRFHLEGVTASRPVMVYKIKPETEERLGLLATASVGEGGWVDLPEPIIVQAGDAFIAVPQPEGIMNLEPFEIAAQDATSADAIALIAGLSEELARRYDHADDGSGHFRSEEMTVPRSIFLVGRLAGRPVACGAVRPLDGEVGEVKRMYVRPEVRGRGLSRRLLTALEETACRMGYVALRLETGDRQPEAIRLYESAGYHRIEPFSIYVGSQRSVCFEKRLT